MMLIFLLSLASHVIVQGGTTGASIETPVVATFCQLVEHPATYHNRHVRISGHLAVGFETFALVDNRCPTDNRTGGMIWLDSEDDGGVVRYRPFSIGAPITSSAMKEEEWTVPTSVKPVEKGLKALEKAIKDAKVCCPLAVTIVGRFEYVQGGRLTERKDGTKTYSSGFGHLGGFSRRIVLERIRIDSPR